MAPYFSRLLCLCLACFFIVNLTVGSAVSLLAPVAIQLAGRLRPRFAARLLLALRLFPFGFALAVAVGLCLPSYLQFEPAAPAEQIGFVCLAAAILAAVAGAFSITRALRAVVRSFRYIRRCQDVGRRVWMPHQPTPVWVVEGKKPFLALTGVVRPRLIVSQGALKALSPEQLAVAMRHERAHLISSDNLKRLLMLLTPGILPGWRGFGVIEAAWARFTEWAADDSAVAGDSGRSLSLAAALVRFARMGAAAGRLPLESSLLTPSEDLPARVNRLLRTDPAPEPKRHWLVLAASASLILASSLATALLQPAALHNIHGLLERLID